MPEPRLFDALRQLAATLTGMAATRLALLANEWHEERVRLTEILLLSVLVLFLLGGAVVLGTAFLVVLFWDTHRLLVLGGLGILFAVLGGLVLLQLRSAIQQKPKLFAASLAELQRDRASLS